MLRCIMDDGKLNPSLVQLFRLIGGSEVKRFSSTLPPEKFLDLFSSLSEEMRLKKTGERMPTPKEIQLLKKLDLHDEVRVAGDAEISGFALFAMQPDEFTRTLQFFGQRLDRFNFSELFLFTRNAFFPRESGGRQDEFEHEPFKWMVLGQSWIARLLERKKAEFVHMRVRGTEVWWKDGKIRPKMLFDAYLDSFLKNNRAAPEKGAFLFPQPTLQVVRAYAERNQPGLVSFFAGPEADSKTTIGYYLTVVTQVLGFELEAAKMEASR